MRFESPSFQHEGPLPERFAFGVFDAAQHVRLGENANPAFRWGDLPPGTRSVALVCHDPDVPTVGTDVNQEGRTVAASLPRTDFFHWVLVDLPPTLNALQEGELSRGVTAGGKQAPRVQHGARQGINDYTGWFASDPAMQGDYYGYDGPCPPWNDELLHHYHFTLYALDVSRLEVPERFTGADARRAMDGHVLGQRLLIATYALNPALRR